MKIPYMKNDASATVHLLIDVEHLMDRLIAGGKVDDPIDGNYAHNSYNMCNIMTFIIGKTLNDIAEPNTLIVHEGVFNMQGNHTWLSVEDIIIDATLAQFVSIAEPLSIVDASWDRYQSVRTFTYDEWVEQSMNVGA